MILVEVGASSIQGPRAEMQDEFFYNAGTIGVFDGHGQAGDYVARLAKQAVESASLEARTLKNLLTRTDPDSVDTRQARVVTALSYADGAIRKNGGTTATVASFNTKTNTLGVIWAGDSPAYLLDAEGGTRASRLRLTTAHDVTNPEEVARLAGKGVDIHQGKYFNMHGGKIMLSRAIGDPGYKKDELLATPQSVTTQVQKPSLLVVGSDGVLSSRTTPDVIYELQRLMSLKSRPGLHEIASRLTAQYARITQDNATVVLARLDPS